LIQTKPSAICNGCIIYGEKCHCLCHEQDFMNGQHEIIYAAGDSPHNLEYPNERT
jgi:hypothetical protein